MTNEQTWYLIKIKKEVAQYLRLTDNSQNSHVRPGFSFCREEWLFSFLKLPHWWGRWAGVERVVSQVCPRARFSWKRLVVAASSLTCWRSSGDFQGKWNASVTLVLVGHSGPNRSLPRPTKQPGRAPYPRHVEQPSLFWSLLCSLYVLMSFCLSVCVSIAQLSQLTGIGKENFWKTHH